MDWAFCEPTLERTRMVVKDLDEGGPGSTSSGCMTMHDFMEAEDENLVEGGLGVTG